MTSGEPYLTEVQEAVAQHERSLASEPSISFGVITRVPDPPDGNLAAILDLFYVPRPQEARPEHGYREQVERLPPTVALALRAPVFDLGEVLVLNSDGREIVGRGRKPSKWDVDCETYADVTAAVIRSWQVTGRL